MAPHRIGHRRSPLGGRDLAGATAGSGSAARLEDRAGDSVLARLDALAVRAADRPLAVLGALLALNLTLLPVFIGAGAAFGDQALFFREGLPGTWLSFAQLLAVAVAARAVHRRDRAAFWGLSAAVFVVFAVDEITQAGLFLSQWLEGRFDIAPASGFNDLDSVLLSVLFVACGLLLASRARVLLSHPWTVGLLGLGALLGAASQSLDSFAAPTRWEFVAEESLKLSAEPFFIVAFLVALATVLRRSAADGSAG